MYTGKFQPLRSAYFAKFCSRIPKIGNSEQLYLGKLLCGNAVNSNENFRFLPRTTQTWRNLQRKEIRSETIRGKAAADIWTDILGVFKSAIQNVEQLSAFQDGKFSLRCIGLVIFGEMHWDFVKGWGGGWGGACSNKLPKSSQRK